ncbi:MAG: alpha/beta hydrolase [Anaerolineae bacterium]
MIVVAYLLSFFCLILNALLFVQLGPPYNFMFLWIPQLLHHALSPVLVVIGAAGAVLGWRYNAPLAIVAGVSGAGMSVMYIWSITRPHPGFTLAFGTEWQSKIPPQLKTHLLQSRWNIGLPQIKAPRWERNMPFWTIPVSDRELLCDLWQPNDDITPSGLAVIFLHGSAWYLSDKDFLTRPFFQQLTAQGHVVMDVAYRLCPEVDIYDMVGDVKRAVAWLKRNASEYHVDPERIVLAGASAGGHLAMLAAYAPDHAQLTPPELANYDLSVRAVFSYYGPPDLRVAYQHMKLARTIGLPKLEIGLPGAAEQKKNFQDAGRLDTLLGGHLHEIPEIYELASPVCHVHAGCPPTLLIQGTLDCITPATAAQELHRRLVECDVPAINIIFPWTQHGFDLLLPQISPPAQAALYEVERFLALVL